MTFANNFVKENVDKYRGMPLMGLEERPYRPEGSVMEEPRSEANVDKSECSRHVLSVRTMERLVYLSPRRYFRFYLLYVPETEVSCWLPEGFST